MLTGIKMCFSSKTLKLKQRQHNDFHLSYVYEVTFPADTFISFCFLHGLSSLVSIIQFNYI